MADQSAHYPQVAGFDLWVSPNQPPNTNYIWILIPALIQTVVADASITCGIPTLSLS